MLFVALAAVFRSRAELWQRRQREIRNEERLALARELHDTVAHHVSAIAVQAQAGGVVVRTQPEQAAAVLATIEAEASRTLAEMRDMVRVIRADSWDAYSPQPGVAELPRLARADAIPDVDVSLSGAVTGLPGPVDAAVYRIAQEAVTNDGVTPAGSAAPSGFGLTGMAERAQLLGGSLSAGPGPDGGWVVEAVLPVQVSR